MTGRATQMAVVLLGLGAIGCGSQSTIGSEELPTQDASTGDGRGAGSDAGTMDAGTMDAGERDAASPEGDAALGPSDAGQMDASAQNTDGGAADGAVADAGTVSSDGGASDGAVVADTGVSPSDGGAVSDDAAIASDAGNGCSLGTVESSATSGTLDVFGQIAYFADGISLPSGSYRVVYEDGCMKYASDQGWTIHAYVDGSFGWWIVGESTSDKKLLPPGTVGYAAGGGAFANFDDCVAANLLLAPKVFAHTGGPLGVFLQDSPYSDNVVGLDNRNPRWRLERVDGCVP